MQCRKCGAKPITRRRAGEFFCQHCGMQPGAAAMDRCGNASTREALKPTDDLAPYVIAARKPRLKAGAAKG